MKDLLRQPMEEFITIVWFTLGFMGNCFIATGILEHQVYGKFGSLCLGILGSSLSLTGALLGAGRFRNSVPSFVSFKQAKLLNAKIKFRFLLSLGKIQGKLYRFSMGNSIPNDFNHMMTASLYVMFSGLLLPLMDFLVGAGLRLFANFLDCHPVFGFSIIFIFPPNQNKKIYSWEQCERI